jgi:multicomponent K+:H+ antiporter subunit D
MTALLGHLVIAPVLLPLLSAVLIVTLGDRRRPLACQAISVGNCAALMLASIYLLSWSATGQPAAYSLGNWPAPYGIVLVLDRLSALMVMLTSVLALAAAWYSAGGWDARGRHFHALLQLQLMGLNGAFLTGDLFNLFVFFELLLIASYGLMLHGGGVARMRATLHYIVFNLVASTLFLLAVSLLYGMTGTLNMADLALQVAAAPAEDATLIQSAGLLLLLVFAVKAAVLPLGFWLQDGYRSASAPVACLFSVMTKVGVYAILRICTLIFSDEAGAGANLGAAWVLPLGLATLAVAAAGVLASRSLIVLVTCMVTASVGSMLIGIGMFTQQGIAAALYYMVNSTFALALLFLLAGEIAHARGRLGTDLLPGPAMDNGARLAGVYLFAAVAAAGLPPVSGFIAKVGLMQSTVNSAWHASVWSVLLVAGLLTVIALARSGSMLFWRSGAVAASALRAGQDQGEGDGAAHATATAAPPAGSHAPFGPLWLLVAALVALTAGARPVQAFLDSTSEQLLHPDAYIESVIRPETGDQPEDINLDGDRLRAGAAGLMGSDAAPGHLLPVRLSAAGGGAP